MILLLLISFSLNVCTKPLHNI